MPKYLYKLTRMLKGEDILAIKPQHLTWFRMTSCFVQFQVAFLQLILEISCSTTDCYPVNKGHDLLQLLWRLAITHTITPN
jgi:hypothetical protein